MSDKINNNEQIAEIIDNAMKTVGARIHSFEVIIDPKTTWAKLTLGEQGKMSVHDSDGVADTFAQAVREGIKSHGVLVTSFEAKTRIGCGFSWSVNGIVTQETMLALFK